MLDLFEKNNVKATFFVIWSCLKLHPALWKRAVEQWHEICNHTMHHNKYFKTWNEAERFESELLWWEKNAKEVLWEDYLIKMKKNYPFFRFPWMHWIRVKAYLDILKKHGYVPIGWRHTKNPESWNINNGDIFLWHFKDADTLNVRKNLEMVLKAWKHPKTVSDIITTEEYDTPIDWTNYAKKRKEASIKK
jgi:peptidoglycan/xylan/chitin deacetylase (PgdA/CDA1 family)